MIYRILEDTIPGAPHFTWREALNLDSVGICVLPEKSIEENLVTTAKVMEHIRKILKCPLRVTSWYRPNFYNQLIGGAPKSYHTQGLAVDFQPVGMSVYKAKIILKEYLEPLGIRMENNGRGNWIHIDLGNVRKSGRFFKP